MSQTSKKDFNFGATTGTYAVTLTQLATPTSCTVPQGSSYVDVQMKKRWCAAQPGQEPSSKVAEWVEFMKSAGVQRVVSLLTDSEVKTYTGEASGATSSMSGLVSGTADLSPRSYLGGPAAIIAALKDAKAKGEKVLLHCWGGGGRTGVAQAAWLVMDKGLSPEAAAAAVSEYSQKHGLSRRVDVAALKEFVAAAS
eukprot:gene9851-10010_t